MAKYMDPRSRRTQQTYREALTRLLRTKPLEQISISELSTEAALNRSTFYLHYTNVMELLDEIEADMLAQFQAMLERFTGRPGDEPVRFFDPHDRRSIATLAELFTLIRDNADFAAIMLASPTKNRMLRLVLEEGRETCMTLWKTYFTGVSQAYLDHYYTFIASGFIGMIRAWIEAGMRMKPLDLAELCMSFIYRGTTRDNEG